MGESLWADMGQVGPVSRLGHREIIRLTSNIRWVVIYVVLNMWPSPGAV